MDTAKEIAQRIFGLNENARGIELRNLAYNHPDVYAEVTYALRQLRSQAQAVTRGEAALMEFAEPGSRWMTRDGHEVVVSHVFNHTDYNTYPIRVVGAGYGYFVSRKGFCDIQCKDHPSDVVSAYDKNAQPKEKQVEPEPILSLCVCCSELQGQRVDHDDPCHFTSDERDMKPAIKAMFRETQRKRAFALVEESNRAAELRAMTEIETKLVHSIAIKQQGCHYAALVGRKIPGVK